MNKYHNLAPLTKTGRRFVLIAGGLFTASLVFTSCSRLSETVSISEQEDIMSYIVGSKKRSKYPKAKPTTG